MKYPTRNVRKPYGDEPNGFKHVVGYCKKTAIIMLVVLKGEYCLFVAQFCSITIQSSAVPFNHSI
jgi:hypothetical protein